MFKTVNNGTLPTKGSKFSACIDVYANENITIKSGETKLVPLGIQIDLDGIRSIIIGEETSKKLGGILVDEFMATHYIRLMIRSSLAVKGLMLGNGVGIIDLDYKDEIKMIVHNTSDDYTIKRSDRIGQVMLQEHKTYLMGIGTKAERLGGFGSTGENDV